MKRALVVLEVVASLSAGCLSVDVVAPRVRARVSSAATATVTRVVAVPATCGSLEIQRDLRDPNAGSGQVEECARIAVEAVDQAIRSAIDFAGYAVIDAERVNAITARRHEVERWQETTGVQTSETTGASFDDVTPRAQDEILKDLGADGVLSARIWIGAGVGFGGRRTVAVQVRLVTHPDRRLVWARRCEIEVGATRDPLAMERAARCATEGIRRP